LAGSLIFRSLQFGVYSGVAEWCRANDVARATLPMSDIEWRVVVGSLASGATRATIETPLEAFKVRKQIGAPVYAFGRQLFTGYSVTLLRTCGLMTSFFCLIDVSSRQLPTLLNDPNVGPFFRGGVCATVAWWSVWPFEVAKSQIQAGTSGPSRILPRLLHIARTQGVAGFSRGFLAGSIRSVLANGASFWAYTTCQRVRRRYVQ
jgi:solute carrier family 25 carnitine/acylcarnitine transporter 20/29